MTTSNKTYDEASALSRKAHKTASRDVLLLYGMIAVAAIAVLSRAILG